MGSYIAVIHKDVGSDYGVSFPDFPGCITAGSTIDEAKGMAGEALGLHIKGMLEDGETIPEPRNLEAVMADDLSDGALAFFVVDVPEVARATCAST